jgi:hypothetical protein
MALTAEERNGIFHGESGGDYNALFGFQNRPGGKFEHIRLTDMTIDQALEFANPRGEYGQTVKGQIGRVATPMGAYQIVGTTLRAAKEALGLTGNEPMTPETQDMIADWIAENQGLSAWEGYKGPRSDGPAQMETVSGPAGMPVQQRAQQTASPDRNPVRLAMAYASGKMTPEDAAIYERGMAEGVFPEVKKSVPLIKEDTSLQNYGLAMAQRRQNQAPPQFGQMPVFEAKNATPFPGLKG